MNPARQLLRQAVRRMQGVQGELYKDLPDKASTPGQRELTKKHGTPREFAEAVAHAIGEISVDEAHQAIEKYRKEWTAA